MKKPFRPVNDDHAIEWVAFSLQFDAPFSDADFAEIRSNHSLWAAELPAAKSPPGVMLNVDPSGAVTVAQSAGVEFCRLRPDGTAIWSLQWRGAELVVECTRYTRWDKISSFAYSQIKRALELRRQDSPVKLVRASLMVRDAFRTEDGEGDLKSLLVESDLLPSSVFQRGANWHAHSGWFEEEPLIGSLLVNLNLDAQIENALPRNRVGVTNILTMTYMGDTQSGAGETMAWLEPRMELLHERNKTLLFSLLSPPIVERIGLLKGAIE